MAKRLVLPVGVKEKDMEIIKTIGFLIAVACIFFLSYKLPMNIDKKNYIMVAVDISGIVLWAINIINWSSH